MSRPFLDLRERLDGKSVPDPSGCRLWTGWRLPQGYGEIQVRGRHKLAHRVAWELEHGPIPDGMCVCHRCDTPACINVAHLFIGTSADNTADKVAKGRHLHGEAVRRKLTKQDALAILDALRAGESVAGTARRWGVGNTTVKSIADGSLWRRETEGHRDGIAIRVANPNPGRGEAVRSSKVTAADVVAIRLARTLGESVANLARHYQVSQRALRLICQRVTWRHVP
jgi:hypothetical protein